MEIRLFNILILLLTSKLVFSQSISNKEFRKSEWFTSNKDSLFYKSDTLRFIKRSNPIKGFDDLFEESEYYDDTESIILKFVGNKYLNFYDKKFHTYSLDLRKWNLNKKDSILTISNRKEKGLTFKIIKLEKVIFKNNQKEFETTEMLVVKK